VQGGWEADETVEAAAARETVEEAGVRGALEVHSAAVQAAVLCLNCATDCVMSCSGLCPSLLMFMAVD
jgi:8-oxo-dGTP pyrophosphatase MutT (NUDIX family)